MTMTAEQTNHSVEQKSEAWHAIRMGKITGSRVGAILGHNPHQSRDDVMREMVRQAHGAEAEFKGNEATRHGEKWEPYAVAWYEANNKVQVTRPGIIVHPNYDWIAISPDGLVGLNGGIEVKCPFYARVPYSVYDDKKRHYLDQCLLLMEVADLDWVDFICWISDDICHVDRVKRDENRGWLAKNLVELKRFHDEFMKIVASEKLSAPYLKDRKKDTPVTVRDPRLDRLGLLHQLLNSHEQHIAPIREEYDKLKVEIFEEHGACSNGSVSVSCSERKGSVDYRKAVSDIGEETFTALLPEGRDLDSYRRKANFVYTVKLEEK